MSQVIVRQVELPPRNGKHKVLGYIRRLMFKRGYLTCDRCDRIAGTFKPDFIGYCSKICMLDRPRYYGSRDKQCEGCLKYVSFRSMYYFPYGEYWFDFCGTCVKRIPKLDHLACVSYRYEHADDQLGNTAARDNRAIAAEAKADTTGSDDEFVASDEDDDDLDEPDKPAPADDNPDDIITSVRKRRRLVLND